MLVVYFFCASMGLYSKVSFIKLMFDWFNFKITSNFSCLKLRIFVFHILTTVVFRHKFFLRSKHQSLFFPVPHCTFPSKVSKKQQQFCLFTSLFVPLNPDRQFLTGSLVNQLKKKNENLEVKKTTNEDDKVFI